MIDFTRLLRVFDARTVTDLLSELFDPRDGHEHDGDDSRKVAPANLEGVAAGVTADNLNALVGGGNVAKAAGGHGHALAAGASDVTATAAQVNTLVRDAGQQAVSVVDFNTGAAEAACKVTIDGVDYQEADAEDLPNGVWTSGASAADSATSFAAAV
nr:hypothetical protein [Anaerolineae bacterium]